MDRVAADLERAWNEVESELRTIALQLDDELFRARAKPHELEELERRRVRAQERRHWIEMNRERTWTTGTLPSLQSGLWRPLSLNPTPRVEETEDDSNDDDEDASFEPSGPLPAPTIVPAPTAEAPNSATREQLLQQLAELVRVPMSQPDEFRRFEAILDLRPHDPELGLLAAMLSVIGSVPRSTRRKVRRQLKALGMRLPALPVGQRAESVPPPLSLEVGASVDDGLAQDERHVVEAMRRQAFDLRSDPRPISSLQCQLALEDVRRILRQLSHPLATSEPLVEYDGERARLSLLGQSLFAADGTWLTLPFSLILLRGVDGIPPHNLREVLQAARSALVAMRMNMKPDTFMVDTPDYPWGGMLEFATGQRLHDSCEGVVTVGGRVTSELGADSMRARVLVRELPPQLNPEEIARRIRALNVPGLEQIEVRAGGVEVEVTHAVYALWLQAAIHRTAIGQATWRVRLPSPMHHLLTQPIERCVERVLAVPGGPLDELEAEAMRLEGLLVFLDLGEQVLHVLRDAETDEEMKFALTHLTRDELRSVPSFARHSPLASTSVREAANRVVMSLNETQPLSPQSVRGDYAAGFSQRQAEAIAGTKRLKSLVRSVLLRELRDVVDELTRRRAQHTERKRALDLIDAELASWLERFQPPRRTWRYRTWS